MYKKIIGIAICMLVLSSIPLVKANENQNLNLEIENIAKTPYGINASIKNIGNKTVENVSWQIKIYGIIVTEGKLTKGIIPSIEPANFTIVGTENISGFGPILIVISAWTPPKWRHIPYKVSKIAFGFLLGQTLYIFNPIFNKN